jgi:hypothetical protein
MPKVEIDGELSEVIDCPICGRTVLETGRAATGFIAPCGRRLINLAECVTALDLCKREA